MTDRNQKLADLLQSWMDEDKAVRAELEALRAVAEAADLSLDSTICTCANAACPRCKLHEALAKYKALKT